MTKKHFIALADAIREHNKANPQFPFGAKHFDTLASFCAGENRNFNASRWYSYIAGECGPSGGSNQELIAMRAPLASARKQLKPKQKENTQ